MGNFHLQLINLRVWLYIEKNGITLIIYHPYLEHLEHLEHRFSYLEHLEHWTYLGLTLKY